MRTSEEFLNFQISPAATAIHLTWAAHLERLKASATMTAAAMASASPNGRWRPEALPTSRVSAAGGAAAVEVSSRRPAEGGGAHITTGQ